MYRSQCSVISLHRFLFLLGNRDEHQLEQPSRSRPLWGDRFPVGHFARTFYQSTGLLARINTRPPWDKYPGLKWLRCLRKRLYKKENSGISPHGEPLRCVAGEQRVQACREDRLLGTHYSPNVVKRGVLNQGIAARTHLACWAGHANMAKMWSLVGGSVTALFIQRLSFPPF